MQTITFEQIPKTLSELNFKVDEILRAMSENRKPETDKLFAIEELIEYLPEKPARQTVYGWINSRTIPYEKHGKRCYFRKSLIDNWSANGRRV
ncbi:MAG: helix-turn-helix domain-containing protein [Bacteroidales bacterium]